MIVVLFRNHYVAILSMKNYFHHISTILLPSRVFQVLEIGFAKGLRYACSEDSYPKPQGWINGSTRSKASLDLRMSVLKKVKKMGKKWPKLRQDKISFNSLDDKTYPK